MLSAYLVLSSVSRGKLGFEKRRQEGAASEERKENDSVIFCRSPIRELSRVLPAVARSVNGDTDEYVRDLGARCSQASNGQHCGGKLVHVAAHRR
jgi:hypothetical protein